MISSNNYICSEFKSEIIEELLKLGYEIFFKVLIGKSAFSEIYKIRVLKTGYLFACKIVIYPVGMLPKSKRELIEKFKRNVYK